jgi:dienelactone hydrolase
MAVTLASHAAFLEKDGFKVYRPFGPGPFPVALQLHGCGGLQPFQARYAEAAVKAGVAVVVIDSFRPRGISRLDGSLFVCTGAMLRGSQRAADLFAAMDWLKRQPWADSERVLAAGWSHGAWTIMDALAQGEACRRITGVSDADHRDLARRLRGVLLVYPYASFPSLTSARGWGGARPRTFAVIGGRDQVVGERGPRRALDRIRADGAPVEVLYLPEATHSFDDDSANDPRTRYRPDYEEQARGWYVKALKAAFA